MSTSDSTPTCPRCGAPLTANTPEQLCPACLLSGAMKTLPMAPGERRPLTEFEFPREFGGYRLLGLLGRGGMGAVYEAEQTATGRRVALKVLEQQLDSPDMRQRFLREGRLAAAITHPNSVYIFGAEEIGGQPAIVMEIATGGTLKDLLKRRPNQQLPVAEAVDAILDVIAGLEAAQATLYTLLTGKAPFEGENAVQVVAAVLDQKPKPVAELRADVPAGLAQTVSRCLAKKPENRYPDYEALRRALLPFSSATPEPAPLGIRFLAGFVDEALSSLPVPIMVAIGFAQIETWLGERTLASTAPWIIASVFYLLYHAIPEGLWGASVGKAAFGLRVARPGGRAPGLARAFARTGIGLFALETGTLLTIWTTSAAEYRQAWAAEEFLIGDVLFFFAWWSLFLTMRRGNGFANVMDLASGTRVVVKPKGAPRPVLTPNPEPKTAEPDARVIGPYQAVEEIVPGRWIAAHDPALRRQVWLIRREQAELDPNRRDVARPGRLRWLQSLSEADATWDAWEAPPGTPLPALLAADPEERPHWEAARHWLHDLAVELDAAGRDETLPGELSLDLVWLTAEGRAVLLDEPWPSAAPAERHGLPQPFLTALADTVDPVTIPLHARPIVRNLAADSFEKLSHVAGSLRALLAKPAKISRAGRAASLFTGPLILALISGGSLIMMQGAEQSTAAKWKLKYPDLPALSDVLLLRHGSDIWTEGPANPQVDPHIAGHYFHLAEVLGSPAGTDPGLPLSEDERQTLLQIFIIYHAVTPEQIAESDRFVAQQLPVFAEQRRIGRTNGFLAVIPASLAIIGLVQLPFLLMFRASLGQWLFGFAAVNKKGERAGRWRLFGRWIITWIPLLLFLFWLGNEIGTSSSIGWKALDLKMIGYGALWLFGVAVAVFRPAQGIQDEWTKSWIVPR